MTVRVEALAESLRAAAATATWRRARRLQALISSVRRQPDNDALANAVALLAIHGGYLAGDAQGHHHLLMTLSKVAYSVAEVRQARTVRVMTRLRGEASDPLLKELKRCSAAIDRLRGELARSGGENAVDGDPGVQMGAASTDFEKWPRPKSQEATVDVVIPVYRGREETLRCIYSVLSAPTSVAYRLRVIDDGSPEPALSESLQRLDSLGLVSLDRNPENLGFVRTVNRGLSAAGNRDVVLLNSDTEVYGDWLGRLRAAAYSAPDIGTATPLSNNATICSYPYTLLENVIPKDTSSREIDRIAQTVNAGEVCAAPTAIGFCMYIRADCLAAVGVFDAETFGRGYGEENDFCVRAATIGYLNVIAADCFVFHRGGVSFAEEADTRKIEAMRVLRRLHPGYEPSVHEFIGRDPLASARRRIDLVRLRERHRTYARKAVLFVTHDLGGGTEQHIAELKNFLGEVGRPVVVLRPRARDSSYLSIESSLVWSIPNCSFDVAADWAELVETLRIIGIEFVHFHHLIDLPDRIRTLPAELGVSYDYTAHDYFPLCPKINLIDHQGVLCEVAGVRACNVCLSREPGPVPVPQGAGDWRKSFAEFLIGAHRVFAPSHDTAGRFERHIAGLKVTVRAHLDAATWTRKEPVRRIAIPPKQGTRVLVLGALSPAKGAHLLRACVLDAERRRLPLEFVVVGIVFDPTLFAGLKKCRVLGPYHNDEVGGMLASLAPDCCFFPAIWPETYSYTLSAVIVNRLFPVVLDVGAPADRLRALAWGAILPRDATPSFINEQLMAAPRPELPPEALQDAFAHYASPADYYQREELATSA
ncbi:MAG: glycosyltransferase [Proteobacteria bacterium]|nr:glycosyltransferase [Pseudomonadota bacterium]MBI3498488.1 glycosyltransferase [Pseudomonadota bacterium]